MADWTTFELVIPVSSQEVEHLAHSDLWDDTDMGDDPLYRMVQYLGAAPYYQWGESDTHVEYADGRLQGVVTFKWGDAYMAAGFLQSLELVLSRRVRNVHMSGYYDDNGSWNEEVHWRCGHAFPIQPGGDFDPALNIQEGKRRSGLEAICLTHPGLSDEELRRFARSFSDKDRVARVIDGQMVVNLSEPTKHDWSWALEHFNMGAWRCQDTGVWLERVENGWIRSRSIGDDKTRRMMPKKMLC